MRNAVRGVLIGSLACLTVPVLPQVALAETTSEPAAIGAYFWRGKLPSTITIGGQTQPNPVNGQDTDADGVARDELAVAVTSPGQSDKETFLLWDLFELDENDRITKFVVTMPLSESGPSQDPAANTVQGGTPVLQACSPKGGVGPTDAGAYELKPEVDLTKCVPGTADAEKGTWTFDVTPLTTTWLTGANFGIAVVPADLTQPFQVVFQPTTAHTAQITYTPGPDEEPVAPVEPPVGLGTTTTTFDSGFSSGDSVLSSGPMTVFDAPVTSEPAPVAEVAEEPVAAPVALAPVAARTVPGAPPIGFWIAAAVLGLVLLAMSLATGAPAVPGAARTAGAPRRQGRVLRQIQGMSLARGTA